MGELQYHSLARSAFIDRLLIFKLPAQGSALSTYDLSQSLSNEAPLEEYTSHCLTIICPAGKNIQKLKMMEKS